MHPAYRFVLLIWLIIRPDEAWAWGPAAHLDFGLTVLGDLALLAPAVAELLRRYRDDFLYGNLAADITIGKNLSPYQLHCHNWQVAFPVLDLAPDDRTRAFAWGYLCHLAADAVAHNYFVPYKTVENYQRRGAAHTYWEIRFDARVSTAVWAESKRLSTRAFATHDRHLGRILTGPLFPFRINKGIFNYVFQFTRMLRWRRTVEAHAKRTPRVLTEEEVAEARGLCIDRVRDLLNKGSGAACLAADPTGHRNLLIALDIRNRLRLLNRQGRLSDPDGVGRLFRPLFLEAIESKLNLPPLDSLCDPDKPATAAPRPRGMLTTRRAARRYQKPSAHSTRSDGASRSRKTPTEKLRQREEKRRQRQAKKEAGARHRQDKRNARKNARLTKRLARSEQRQASIQERKARRDARRQAKDQQEQDSASPSRGRSRLPFLSRRASGSQEPKE